MLCTVVFWQWLDEPERWKSVGDRRRRFAAVRITVAGCVWSQLGIPGGRLRQHRTLPLRRLWGRCQNTDQDTSSISQRRGESTFCCVTGAFTRKRLKSFRTTRAQVLDYNAAYITTDGCTFVFPQSLVFTSTNIRTLSQLNALASMRRLDNLTISGEGNPVTKLSVWRPYVVFRLAHFSLKHINGSEVCSSSSNSSNQNQKLHHFTKSLLTCRSCSWWPPPR